MNILDRLIYWREKHISDKQFTLLLSFLVGVFAAVAAFVLHSLIHQIQHLLRAGFRMESFNWLYLIFPVVGIYLTSLFIKYVVKDNISHGITRVLYAMSRKQSHLRRHNTWSSVIASAITIGFGGSVGAEAPIVLTGSAIGSNLGQMFKMDNRTLLLLVGCGASAAIAGIFKAPIAGLVFTLEVLMVDLTMASLLPILIASVTACCFSYFFTGSASLFQFHMEGEWQFDRVPAVILLGVICGILSLYFMRVMTWCENGFARLKNRSYLRLLFGGVILSSLIFLFPALYGEGYDSLSIFINGRTEADWNQLLNQSIFAGHGELLVVYVGMVVLTKVFATSATNGGGGCGGTFAPSLFIGGFMGFFFSRVWNIHQIGTYIPEQNFTLLGMAGVMAGIMHAPLTGIFLIAELTGGYQLFVPLMIVSVCAYLTICIFEPHSIYAMRLAREGKLITHHTDHAVLTLMSLDSLIDRNYQAVSPDMKMGQLVHSISSSQSGYIPVCDDDNRLLGEIDITRLRHVIFRTELYNRFTVGQVMTPPAATLSVNDAMNVVMKTFDSTSAYTLPVLDEDGRLEGYITRSRVLTTYRQMVADMSDE
ncbi:MAG: chloride channel protein [Prevotella sp.]|nr:chloride channel protein [Prevotella sp.]